MNVASFFCFINVIVRGGIIPVSMEVIVKKGTYGPFGNKNADITSLSPPTKAPDAGPIKRPAKTTGKPPKFRMPTGRGTVRTLRNRTERAISSAE